MINRHLTSANQGAVGRESLGSLLRSAREKRRATLAEAATVTRISQRILTALEADDFAALPAEVFTRGFIKLYAEYLELDINAVLTLFTDQENLDPERPADRPYRSDILHGKAMANPLHFFKGNPRLRIIAILLAALLSFYTLGAIFKSMQKHPDQDSPENDLAKSLVNGQPQDLPTIPGEEAPLLPEPANPEPAEAPALSGPPTDPSGNSSQGSLSAQGQPEGYAQQATAQPQSAPPYPRFVAPLAANTPAPAGLVAPQQTTPQDSAATGDPVKAEPDYRRLAPSAAAPR